MTTVGAVVIAAALNGGRHRAENPAIPFTAAELASEARRCADEGATIFHVHARNDDGGWTADPERYLGVVQQMRAAVPEGLVSITSLRPDGVAVEAILELLAILAAGISTKPDLISINLGHIVVWEPVAGVSSRRTIHYPNAYDDIVRLLAACRDLGIQPELGVMDLGFVSNAVALRDDERLPEQPWFLIELDSESFGSGAQVAPSTAANYDALAASLHGHIPAARWAAHGLGVAGYAVIERALAEGAHIRVGFEDAVHRPDGRLARSNAELVTWAAARATRAGRVPASFAQTRAITGCASDE